jgi:hypothetical protein
MTPDRVVALAAGVIGAALLVVAGTVWRIDVRHSAPYGFSKTIDFNRSIAVRGGYITPNYDDFDRLDLDLRSYSPQTIFDLTVHIRPAVPGAGDVRTLHLDLPASKIDNRKPAFADPFVTVRFPPIGDSAGQIYYVWVDPGIRNRDDIVALWSIKSYSRVPAWRAVSAFVNEAPRGAHRGSVRLALILLLFGLIISSGWFLSQLVAASTTIPGGLSTRMMRWHRHEADGIQ